MKKLFYTDLKHLSSEQLGNLQMELANYLKTGHARFLLKELMFRRDVILYDNEIDSKIKEGSLTQLCSLIDLLGGSGVDYLNNVIQKGNGSEKTEIKKILTPEQQAEFNKKALK